MTDPEERIRLSLARTAERAPKGELDLDRLDLRESSGPGTHRRRLPVLLSAACVVVVIAVAFAVLGSHLHETSAPAPYAADPTSAIPPNPSTHPDFALCDALSTTAGRDGVLLRAVTVSAARTADWLETSFSTYPGLDPTAETTICVFETDPQPVPGPATDADGVRVLAQSTSRWAVEGMGPVDSLFAGLDVLAAEQQARLNSRPMDGFFPGTPPGKPCLGAQRASLTTSAHHGTPMRLPDSVLAHAGNLEGWMCDDIPVITAPGIKITFESGYKTRSRAQLEKDAYDSDHPSPSESRWPSRSSTFVATTLGSPVLVSQPTQRTLGEVMYVHDGTLMRVLGDGTVPTAQLLAVVQTSTPLGDRTVP
jgi:hypothetical protein